jgi:hypothetical protein
MKIAEYASHPVYRAPRRQHDGTGFLRLRGDRAAGLAGRLYFFLPSMLRASLQTVLTAARSLLLAFSKTGFSFRN